MTTTEKPAAIDRFLNGRLLLRQTPAGHRSGTDAVLLAAAAGVAEGVAIDAGAGVGAAGLAVALRSPAATIALVEIDPVAADLARQNIDLNGLAGRASVVGCDLLSARARREAGLEAGRADLVIANPPWLTPGRVRASPDAARSLAHVAAGGDAEALGLDGWMRAIAALLRPGGRMVAIHRADGLAGLLASSSGRFGDLAIYPVFPKDGQPAIRAIVSGVKGSRGPLRLLRGLALHGPDGAFTSEAEAIHRGERLIEM